MSIRKQLDKFISVLDRTHITIQIFRKHSSVKRTNNSGHAHENNNIESGP